MLVSTGVSLFWLDKLPDVSSLAGMMVGVYTGGTPNLTAIGMALEVSEETFILMNAADLVVGASYFFFLLSVGIRLFGKFLVPFKNPEPVNHLEEEDAEPFDLKQMASGLALTVLIVGSTVGLSLAIFSKMSVPFIILLITSFAVAASFNKKNSSSQSFLRYGQLSFARFLCGHGKYGQPTRDGARKYRLCALCR
jgi:uncharacterized membrane protein